MDTCLDRVSDVFLFVRIIRMGALVTEESEKRIDIFRHNRETKFVNVHVLVDCAIAVSRILHHIHPCLIYEAIMRHI